MPGGGSPSASSSEMGKYPCATASRRLRRLLLRSSGSRLAWPRPLSELRGDEGVGRHDKQHKHAGQAPLGGAFLAEAFLGGVFSGKHLGDVAAGE